MSQVVKNPTDPSYLARQDLNLGAVAAGSGGITSKFVAFAALQLFALTGYLATAGTSTYTNTVNGTGTNYIDGQQVSVIVVSNANALSTGSASLSTATYGPYLVGGLYTPNGTTTAQVGGSNQYPLNTNTGTAGYGGVPVPAGSLIYCVSGTDTTAVSVLTLDYQVQFEAPVTQ